jgi:hypothetical protein
MLQYADDTLIFLRCSREAVLQTKHILQIFEETTSLSINFHKTTFLPVAVPDTTANDLAVVFGTMVSSFPQTYLGLPLSTNKLSVTDCLPLISSVNKHLSGLSASLLNRSGRLVLSTAILSSIPLHAMSAMSIPKMVVNAIDRRRHAFFWTGEDSCHGSKCLVAWDNVRARKAQGGLGVKDLEL